MSFFSSRFRVREKLFLVSLLILVPVGLLSGVLLEANLRSSMLEQSETILEASTRSVVVGVRNTTDAASVDEQVDRYAKALDIRVTVIGPGGEVIGDSERSLSELTSMENHANRPEVVEALEAGVGWSHRFSSTIGQDMVYFAVALESGQVVRGAKSLQVIQERVSQLRKTMLVAGFAGFVFALFMSFFASYLMTRDLLRLVRYSRAITEDESFDGINPLPVAGRDELASLARALATLDQDRKRSAKKLSTNAQRFEDVLDVMEAGVLVFDGLGVVKVANPAAYRLLGKSDLVGLTIQKALSKTGLKKLVKPRSNQPKEIETELGDGIKRHVLASVTRSETTQGGMILLQDLTESRRLQKVRSDFVANASHELRTPLGIIRANAEILLDGALEDEEARGRFVEAVMRNADRLSDLVNDLLDLSKIEAAGEFEELVPVDLHQLIGNVFEDLNAGAESKQIQLVNQTQTDITLQADPGAMVQIFTNLVENAIRHIPDQSKVVVRSERVDRRAIIYVEDDGPGIAPKYRNRVFERFFRVDKGRARSVGGTGLGLSIVRHLVESMGGEIRVEESSEGGACFVISLDC